MHARVFNVQRVENSQQFGPQNRQFKTAEIIY